MKRYRRLALITAAGIASMLLLTWGLYVLRDELVVQGVTISDEAFLLAFFVLVGGVFGISAAAAMREIKRLNTQGSA